ncbi:ATPase, T2SS/T4P/T4SS family [Acidiferrobacter thiooxydans]|uniref:Bacterial type II secretion system protein E domain-containing protein n=1 Tax=Acidiferrobacter thiooxydans TaxID=163359 RepID=A0A368HJ15_9GAMM|nr:hypothetical protein C4900_06660 [Acidiferrobacter thiooxydans]
MLFIGEVRGPLEAAAVVLQAGIGGPIITTIHAESVETAIERLTALAAHEIGPEGATSQIAAHLAAVVHLTLSSRPIGTSRRHGVTPAPLLLLSTQLLRVRPRRRGIGFRHRAARDLSDSAGGLYAECAADAAVRIQQEDGCCM